LQSGRAQQQRCAQYPARVGTHRTKQSVGSRAEPAGTLLGA